MIKKKLKNAIFLLSSNIRISTKELSKHIKSSQQSASYIIHQLKKKKLVKNEITIVDPIKLGFINIIVGFNYVKFDAKIRAEVIDVLKNTNSIISIKEASRGVDFIVEYCVQNLSAFNKIHSEIIHKLHHTVKTKFIFPIVVKHKHDRCYLIEHCTGTDIVICGDREVNILSTNEKSILKELIKTPTASYTSIAKSTKISVKSVINIKKKLEKLRIIRGYSCILNHKALGINRSLLLLKLSGIGVGEINKLVEFGIRNLNIIEQIKIIGDYHIILIIESIKNNDLIKELRSRFSIEEYWSIQIDNIDKEYYLPRDIEE
ncbi:MAG: AsnC family transcriptional regulator [Nanoarchaeota archaeon]|nr:AsnC family transcriptional regulator [Nanoarchaeota archaeon]MBU1321496.1 AsnC family transcriptional regulator [Nanoarchaeota archaeon]MBU1597380.1 AsnC family transcriptional regulator [Nanoarchaeota archaeon]MBU2441207.1 AsnC family transcriptional regulator [Nanoarchaeota archaeon]